MQSLGPLDIPRRLRRLRATTAVRTMVQECRIDVARLIAPLFVKAAGPPEPVDSMPEVCRRSIDGVVVECQSLVDLDIQAVALFPCIDPAAKDLHGGGALDPNGLIPQTVRAIKRRLPQLVVITDIALDPYTNHGHDGVLNAGGTDVDNDATVRVLCQMAVVHAEAGVDWVAPSDMMDGRVKEIRRALDGADSSRVAILSYAAKFASAYYGPFRDAVGSAGAAGDRYLDKRSYQLDPSNRREAILEALLDESEGADVLMVKPAGPYLDILHELRGRTLLPLVGYQVSGEYSQIHAAARLGWLDLEKVRDESILGIHRAGADLVITYFAKAVAQKLATPQSSHVR